MFALVTKIISFIICFCFCLTKLFGQPLNYVPLTLFRPNYNDPIGNKDTKYDYYDIPLCGNAVPPDSTQLQLSLEIPDNPDFKPTPTNLICIQLSTCKDNFSQGCVFATNYVLNTTDYNYYAIANLVINTDKFCTDISNCTVYMRAMAQPFSIQYSVQLTFVSSKPENYLNWTRDDPWNGPGINPAVGASKELSQYWRSDQTYKTSVNEFTYFYIGYCPQQQTPVTEIELAVVSPTDNTVTLLTTFACPKNSVSNYLICNTQAAKINGFYAPYIAPFFILPCIGSDSKPLNDGIYVGVETKGNATNQLNEFIFQAIINPGSSQIGYNKRKK